MVEQDGRLSAQVAVLGSLLIQPELVGQALEKIRPEDFLTPKCRMVFQAIKSLYTEGRPTDPVTVRGRLGGKDGDSWTEYLLELMDLTPTAANVWEYAALMREQARMAKVAELGGLLQAARDLDGARGYIAQLNELIYGESADAETTSLAKRRLLELMRWSEQETTLEGLLRLREFADVLVTVHTDSVNVMVRADALNRQQSAVILDLVMHETGISGGNVKIIPIN